MRKMKEEERSRKSEGEEGKREGLQVQMVVDLLERDSWPTQRRQALKFV